MTVRIELTDAEAVDLTDCLADYQRILRRALSAPGGQTVTGDHIRSLRLNSLREKIESAKSVIDQ